MSLALGHTAPDFTAETTEGPISFHDWIGDSWAVLFSHPKDFTPICTTELGYMAKIKPEFDKRNVKIIGLSVDQTANHAKWAKDIEETQGTAPNYPIIGDGDFNVSKLYGMLPANTSGDSATRTPADNQTVRNVFVIGPDKKVKLILVYPMTTGRNFDEVLRVIDSLQLTAKHRVATPVNWKQGEDVIIAGSVSNEEARQIFGDVATLQIAVAALRPPQEDSQIPDLQGGLKLSIDAYKGLQTQGAAGTSLQPASIAVSGGSLVFFRSAATPSAPSKQADQPAAKSCSGLVPGRPEPGGDSLTSS